MTCDEAKIRMMGFLYGEMEEGEGEEEKLQRHLSNCPTCAADLAGLRQTSHLLRTWQDVDPKLHLRFVEERRPRLAGRKWLALPRWAAMSMGVGAAALLLIALLNLEVSYRDGAFDLRLSLLPRPASSTAADSVAADRYVTSEVLAQVQQQNYRLMQELIEASETRQMEFVTSSLSQFAAEVEAQRRQDLRLVDRGLEAVQVTTEKRLDQTHEILGDLIRLARYNLKPEHR